jgi:ribonuclease-3
VSSSTPQLVDASELTRKLGITLDAELAVLAFTHRSYAYENGGLPTNERLEFLGDAVLGLCVTDALYQSHPDFSEGQLAKLRASIVNMHALAGVGRTIGLGALLRLGKGEELTDGRNKPSLLADAVEALLGAVYHQHGLETARAVIRQLFGELIAAAPSVGAGLDWKTSLQERTATLGLGVPSYRLSEEGPDHAKEFTATVVVAGDSRGVGQGRTKKEAEQKAAALAYGALTPAPADGADSAPDPDSTGDEQSGSTEALDTADAPVTSA